MRKVSEVEFNRGRSLELDEALKILSDWGFTCEKTEKKTKRIGEGSRFENKILIEGPSRFGGSIKFHPKMFKEAVKFEAKPEADESAVPYLHVELRPGESAEFKKDRTFQTSPVKEIPRSPDTGRANLRATAFHSGKEKRFPCVADAGFEMGGESCILIAMEIARELGINWDEEPGRLIELSKEHIVDLYGKSSKPIEIDYELRNRFANFEKRSSLKTWIIDGWEIPLKGRLAILTAPAVDTLETPVEKISKEKRRKLRKQFGWLMMSIISEDAEDSKEELQPCFMCKWKPFSKLREVKLEDDRELRICVDCLSKARENGKILGKRIENIEKAEPFIDENMKELREWE